ncbi:MAG TPA: universal stress protein [Mycobacterium sp.]|nr:universal stress protein [Mycobacterium sp.]
MTHRGIVVGVDGSPSSCVAVRWAAHEAAMRNVVLTVVHVIGAPAWDLVALGGPVAPIQTEPTQRQAQEARKVIDDAVEVVRSSTESGTRPRVVAEVFFAGTVPTLVDLSGDAHLVVVGRRGGGPLKGLLHRVLLGSVSTGLVHHGNCPVAVIHDEAPLALEPWPLPVVLGIDGSPASELATAIAFDEASRRGVELVALHAWTGAGTSDVGDRVWTGRQAQAEEALAERLAGWQESYPDVDVRRRLVWNHPAGHLLEEAEFAQLVVVGSRGRGGFAGMLLGSVSTAVVQEAPVPVIVARLR